MCRSTARKCFNPRAHAGRDIFFAASSDTSMGFNPRAHAGRDYNKGAAPAAGRVSIHAPTQGATGEPANTSIQYSVAIHAPTQGATGGAPAAGTQFSVSIHAPTQGATMYIDGKSLTAIVSIHAPTQGATSKRRSRLRGSGGFNPRAHAGRDLTTAKMQANKDMFQSTRPRRARPSGTPHCAFAMCFNPRAHAGRDTALSSRPTNLRGFNPRAHAGRDAEYVDAADAGKGFQSTRPRRARPQRCIEGLKGMIKFQSTRPRRARPEPT